MQEQRRPGLVVYYFPDWGRTPDDEEVSLSLALGRLFAILGGTVAFGLGFKWFRAPTPPDHGRLREFKSGASHPRMGQRQWDQNDQDWEARRNKKSRKRTRRNKKIRKRKLWASFVAFTLGSALVLAFFGPWAEKVTFFTVIGKITAMLFAPLGLALCLKWFVTCPPPESSAGLYAIPGWLRGWIWIFLAPTLPIVGFYYAETYQMANPHIYPDLIESGVMMLGVWIFCGFIASITILLHKIPDLFLTPPPTPASPRAPTGQRSLNAQRDASRHDIAEQKKKRDHGPRIP